MTDVLAPFQRLILVMRWAVLVVATGLVVANTVTGRREAPILGFVALWTAARSWRPIRFEGRAGITTLAIGVELLIAVAAVVSTGRWDSPFVFCLLPGVAIAGFARSGISIGVVGMCIGVTITMAEVFANPDFTVQDLRPSVEWTMELVVLALVAGVGHKVLNDAERLRSVALDRMSQLTEANDLLLALHRVAQTLPASLDLDDVLHTTAANARTLLGGDTFAILLRDETLPSWVVALAQGARLGATLNPDELPAGVISAIDAERTRSLADLPEGATGLSPGAASGLYAPLRARGSLLGVLVIEHAEAGRDGARAADLLDRLAEPAAMAIDNARWFGRIKTVTADEERGRIARDLHDRIGQSLAYLAFELDRIAKQAIDTPLSADIDRLRADVRKVVGEVRETLYDLRTEVNEKSGFVPTLQSFLDRLADRTGMVVTFQHSGIDGGVARSIPNRQERELWRIAQEAITNVERHASATKLSVAWRSDGRKAELEIADDGKGFAAGAGRTDSYGMLGIRERAGAIGARMEIISEPGQGTVVRCRWEI